MKRYRWIVTALAYSVATTPLSSQEEDIVVHLQTESRLLPLYLAPIAPENPGFDSAYLNQLTAVLRHDFAHNGTTRLINNNADRDSLALRTSKHPGEQLHQWKGAGVSHLLAPLVRDKELSARLLSVGNGAVKEVSGIGLSGVLAEDRRQIHKLADSLHKELTGVPGIASTHLLYIVRSQGEGGKWISEVWESDYDGANSRRVTRAGEYCVTPSYVPPKPGTASNQCVYVSYTSGQPRIILCPLKEGQGRRACTAKGNQLMPTISRQRDKLAFICDMTGSPDLLLQPFLPETGEAGKLQTLFHNKGSSQSTPTFSPDGREIAFTSDKDGQPRIYLMTIPPAGADPRKAKPKLVSRRALNGSAPTWSPDGKKIAFCALTQGTRQIWMYDREREEEVQLTFGPSHKENPSWAPNSVHLVFNTASPGDNELFMVDINTVKPLKINLIKGEKHYPNWEPSSG